MNGRSEHRDPGQDPSSGNLPKCEIIPTASFHGPVAMNMGAKLGSIFIAVSAAALWVINLFCRRQKNQYQPNNSVGSMWDLFCST